MSKAKKPTRARSSRNSLEGWADIIRRQGEESRAFEKSRAEAAEQFIGAILDRDMPTLAKVVELFNGYKMATIRVDEFLTALEKALQEAG